MDHLFNGAARDAHYNGNMAQYLVDLHDSKATFDFCGGMLFQFVLSVKLRQNLIATSKMDTKDCTVTQPVIYDAGVNRMAKMPNYGKSASADDVTLFHGREIRKVRTQAAHTSILLHDHDEKRNGFRTSHGNLADQPLLIHNSYF